MLAATPPAVPSQMELPAKPAPEAVPLEQRVRMLEEAVKEIRETRFTGRPTPEPEPPPPAPPLPAPPPLNLMLPPPVPIEPPPTPPLPPRMPTSEMKRTWLLKEMWAEARAIQYMFFDPRYTMPWGGRFLPLVLLVAFVTTHIWLPGATLTGVGPLLEKGVDLILGFALFKVLGHEARRYRETAPDLPPFLKP